MAQIVVEEVNIPPALSPVKGAPDALASATPAAVPKSAANRLLFVEPIRAYAMLIVVFIHVASILAPHYKTIPAGDWWVSNMYHAFSKGGPPLFTMVSGLLLLSAPASQPLGVFFRKRFLKVLIPFLGWAGVYLGWRLFFVGESLDANQMINAVLDGPIYYHLWFIQMILGLYLATPILRVYVQHASQSNLTYFALVWFIGTTCLPTIERLFDIRFGIDLVVMTQYVGYFVLGYALKAVQLNARQLVIVPLIVVTTMLATEYAVYRMMMDQGQTFDAWFLNNLGFNMAIISVGMFLFLKSIPYDLLYARFPWFKQGVLLLASSSLGIYFVHVLLMELLGSGRLGFTLNANTFTPLIGIPLTALVTFALSLAVVQILKRIPGVNIFVP